MNHDPYNFDERQAKEKVGCEVETLVDFSGVPQGTRGRVVRADMRDTGGYSYSLAIEWVIPGRAQPLMDWFSKTEYEKFLREL